MEINPVPNPPDDTRRKQTAGFVRFWNGLTGAHESIVEAGERQQARLSSAIALGIAAFLFMALVATIIANDGFNIAGYFLLGLVVIVTGTYFINRGRAFKVGSALLTVFLTLAGFALAFSSPDRASSSLYSIIPLSLVVGSVLLPIWGLLALTLSTFFGVMALPLAISAYTSSITDAGIFLSLGILLVIATAYRNSVERQRVSEIKNTNKELQVLSQNLEQRVHERTKELAETSTKMQYKASQLITVAEVSRAIASVPEIDALLPTVTRLLSERFGFYHVGIFLLDKTREYAVLRASNSEGGQRMLARGHQLRVGEVGIVGYVTDQGRPRIALDVGIDAVFFANPDLPNTRSEAALPLRIGERIIGALDVQSTQPSAFVQEDIDVLATLADQVSIAIENARLFSETRRALDEVQATYRQYLRQEWAHTTLPNIIGYRYVNQKIDQLSQPLNRPEVKIAIENGDIVIQEEEAILAIPLKIRGETIGVLDIRGKTTNRKWSVDEINAIRSIADRAVLALENARLLQTAQRSAARERTISDISAKISTSVQLDSILETTVQELGRVFGGSEIVLQLTRAQDSETNLLE